MKKYGIYFLFLLLLSYLSCSKNGGISSAVDSIEPDYFTCEVLVVKQADNFECQLANKDILKIKLIGVEIEENKREEAKKFTYSLLHRGTLVRIDMDSYKWDKDGNLLAYVIIPGGRMLNTYLIEKGYGREQLTEPNFRHKGMFYDLDKKDGLNFDENEENAPWLR